MGRVLTTVAALALIVVAVANAGTAADPAPALAAFFDGAVLSRVRAGRTVLLSARRTSPIHRRREPR
ncbi:hypothetical protein P9209_18530 [Prescottella defluvii]|nr:hypothetical protein P9209_18530 [Prescottella defluvii]